MCIRDSLLMEGKLKNAKQELYRDLYLFCAFTFRGGEIAVVGDAHGDGASSVVVTACARQVRLIGAAPQAYKKQTEK